MAKLGILEADVVSLTAIGEHPPNPLHGMPGSRLSGYRLPVVAIRVAKA